MSLRTHEPESCASANSAIPAYVPSRRREGLLVGRGGFEPPKSATADLQSAPFGHSGTYPCIRDTNQGKWSRRWDLNPQPADYKSAALPIELHRRTAHGKDDGDPEGARTLDLQRDRLAF